MSTENWKPLSTAPKDGTLILLSLGEADESNYVLGWYEPDSEGYNWNFITPPGWGNLEGVDSFKDNYFKFWRYPIR